MRETQQASVAPPMGGRTARTPSSLDPSRRRSESHHFTEIVHVLERFCRKHRSVNATQPIGAIFGAKHEVIIAHDLRPVLREECGQPMRSNATTSADSG